MLCSRPNRLAIGRPLKHNACLKPVFTDEAFPAVKDCRVPYRLISNMVGFKPSYSRTFSCNPLRNAIICMHCNPADNVSCSLIWLASHSNLSPVNFSHAIVQHALHLLARGVCAIGEQFRRSRQKRLAIVGSSNTLCEMRLKVATKCHSAWEM